MNQSWTTTLQQDIEGAKEALQKFGGNGTETDGSVLVDRTEINGLLDRIDEMGRKLQVARCNAIGALEAL